MLVHGSSFEIFRAGLLKYENKHCNSAYDITHSQSFNCLKEGFIGFFLSVSKLTLKTKGLVFTSPF